MTVGGRTHDCLSGDIAPPAGPILDDEWPAEAVREPLSDKACRQVRSTAGREAND